MKYHYLISYKSYIAKINSLDFGSRVYTTDRAINGPEEFERASKEFHHLVIQESEEVQQVVITGLTLLGIDSGAEPYIDYLVRQVHYHGGLVVAAGDIKDITEETKQRSIVKAYWHKIKHYAELAIADTPPREMPHFFDPGDSEDSLD